MSFCGVNPLAGVGDKQWFNEVFGEPPNTAGQRPALPN
jgi:hypothetical protein